MREWKFYHGTSRKAFELIQEHGFVLTDPRYHNFLASQGVYLVPNRPLIARRFAKQSGRADFSGPVVIQVHLNLSGTVRTLDLTTDHGMNRLYKAYVKAKQLYSLQKKPKPTFNAGVEYEEYMHSVLDTHKFILDKLNEADNALQADPKRFNWDTAALDIAVAEDDVQLIIAAVREGNSFNLTFSSREPKYNRVPHHAGVGSRDHLEVCVTDLGVIDLQRIVERPHAEDMCEFDEDFVNWVTNIDAMDVP